MAGLRSPHPGSCCCCYYRRRQRATTAINLLLGIFQLLVPCFRPGGAQAQAFAQGSSVVEVWQAEEGDLILSTQSDSEQVVEELSKEHSSSTDMPDRKILHFQPSAIDFGTQPVGLPRAITIYAHNPSRELPVTLNSVIASNKHFHVPPLHSRVIPPKAKTSFRVVFLPTEKGSVENSLFINTSSHGVLLYQTFGVGVPRVSLNTAKKQQPSTHLLFGNIKNIQLKQIEVDTSIAEVSLQCDFTTEKHIQSSCLTDNQILLQISMHGRPKEVSEEFEELKLYMLENLLVTYTLTFGDDGFDTSRVTMYVLNSGAKDLNIKNIQLLSHTDTATVEFVPVLLTTSATNFIKLASFVCKAAAFERTCSRAVQLDRLESSATLKIHPALYFVKGDFGFDPTTLIRLKQKHSGSSVWEMWFTNPFEFSITVNEVSLAKESTDLLKILNFSGPVTLSPGCWNFFSLQYEPKRTPRTLTNLLLATNLGITFEIPLLIHLVSSKQGDLHFEATTDCGVHRSSGTSKAVGVLWHESLSLGDSAVDIDSTYGTELYESLQKIKCRELCREHSLHQNDFQQNGPEGVSSNFNWPHLISESSSDLSFSATAIYNSTVNYFTLKNTAAFPVTAQLMPLSHYPDPHIALNLLSKWYNFKTQAINVTTTEFKLMRESAKEDLYQDNPGRAKLNDEVLQFQLLPGETRRIGVVFTPVDYKKVASLILIRNNWTVLDMVTVEGVGARELLKVGGKLPGLGGVLRFKMPESTLMECRNKSKASKPFLSIRKNFKVENAGLLPIIVTSMSINGYECQGFGFEVLECQSFVLGHNGSHEISIMFTPDFSSSWVIRELALETATGSEFYFILNVTLPHHMLPLCADIVPGPSWEGAFWGIMVLFASLLLVGVIFLAHQQAQCILTEFTKSRPRPNQNSSLLQDGNSVDTVGSSTYKPRGSCKTFTDSCSSLDKGKGKGSLLVGSPSSRGSQNLSKRNPGAYNNIQKKHKCSVYYNKPKISNGHCFTPPTDELYQPTSDGQTPAFQEGLCADPIHCENLTGLRYLDGISKRVENVYLHPENVLDKKEETALPNKYATGRVSPESAAAKEERQANVFPKETNLNLTENAVEHREPEFCFVTSLGKHADNPMPGNQLNSEKEQSDALDHHEGSTHQMTILGRKENCEKVKQAISELSLDRKGLKGPKPVASCVKSEVSVVENAVEDKKKMENNSANIPGKANRTSRKHRRRVPEQTGLTRTEERTEPRTQNSLRSWCPNGNRETCTMGTRADCSFTSTEKSRPALYNSRLCHPSSRKKAVEKRLSSDSCSDYGSSSSSVRASRGSWGSWSSTSSSEGEKDSGRPKMHFIPIEQRENNSENRLPIEIKHLQHQNYNLCGMSTNNSYQTRAEQATTALPSSYTCPSFAEIAAGLGKNAGPYPEEEVWSPQPFPVTNGFEYRIENNLAFFPPKIPSVHNGFHGWDDVCEDQYSGVYYPFNQNNFGSLPDDHMNYQHSFPCSEVQNTDFIGHNCLPTWNADPVQDTPNTWDPTNVINSPPYFSGTRSLSPMSGLFGSIWTPQNNLYESCHPVQSAAQCLAANESQAVMYKPDGYSGFDPFHTYMNFDIWTSSSNRSSNSQLSSDSGFCVMSK
ncbi:transmembrane protein 131-like isoform X2 [Latimeria chalumnae]|uniref:transmembrane protein 131-like isoform X2 n=1 Tax=Latimeria chalumnae TaxID=7897 RepID=UPI0003C155DF|nr:PREDICTED: transmembrane protein 131-like [Latimeria chalumnae]|eukprot:XP_006004924.1 PREDICTED: transmembrane protein 131-like [Latimeria chalumnae]